MKKEINELKIKYKDIEIKKELNLSQEKSNFTIDSKIINNNLKYLESLKTWINPKKIIKAELLYRLSRDGDLISTFHQKCDNKSPTLLIAESLNNRKFGGYTTLNWNLESNQLIDNNTFLFSFDENKKYEKKNKKYLDIQKGNGYGPYFGLCDFLFYKNMRSCKSYIYGRYNFLNGKELANNEDDAFEVMEVEIYQIIEI